MQLDFLTKSMQTEICFSSSLKTENVFWTILRQKKIFLLMEETTYKLFYDELKELVPNALFFVLPTGESVKSLFYYEQVTDAMLQSHMDKESLLLAVGGGSLLDLAGFISSTYYRGIGLALIPTTFLAMTDACLGGKTALNSTHKKNILGSFYPASHILIATDCLLSLPFEHLQSGLAEVVKHALIWDSSLFSFLQKNHTLFLQKDLSLLKELIFSSLHIKKQIVKQDPYEKGLRYSLNFGHTLGHALEGLSEYKLLHGHAVAIGIMIESHLSIKLGSLSEEKLQEIRVLLQEFGFLRSLPSFSYQELHPFLCADKKNKKGQIHSVLLSSIGKVHPADGEYRHLISQKEIEDSISWYRSFT